jgi:Family of unknown function (DUF6365)
MRVLLVTPVENGSGETITSVHIGQDLRRAGNDVVYLASSFARKFIEPVLPGTAVELGSDGSDNLNLWRRTVADFSPDAVVFADYPLMSMPFGVAPMLKSPGWKAALDDYPGILITLDHFGFAQREMALFFGPPHLTPFQYHRFEAIPERMEILLPCPMHEPLDVPCRRGLPFRYWDAPLAISAETKASVRSQYLGGRDEFLILHSVPNWAWQAAEMMQIPLYRYLPILLDRYFGDLPKPVTVVSVNNGKLLDPEKAPRIRIVNLSPLSVAEFEALVFAADLMVTENRVSISCGKAVCGFQTCATLVNRLSTLELVDSADPVVRKVVAAMEGHRFASVYPFEVFPCGMVEMLHEIILYQGSSLPTTFCDLEIFGGEETTRLFHRLLTEDELRGRLRAAQEYYVGNLARLPRASEAIAALARGVGV